MSQSKAWHKHELNNCVRYNQRKLSILRVTIGVVLMLGFSCPAFAQFTPVVPTSSSANDDRMVHHIVSRCIDTYTKRSCALCTTSSSDKDVCWVDNNSLFDDVQDLGGQITGRQVPPGDRYFAVHKVLDAVLRLDPQRDRTAWKCTIDFHGYPDERDTFKEEHDEHLYLTNPDLFGSDWCYVREDEYRQTIMLIQMLESVRSSYETRGRRTTPNQRVEPVVQKPITQSTRSVGHDPNIYQIITRCLDTYTKRSCALCTSSSSDKDVCWVENNSSFDDINDLGGRVTGRKVPDGGRYFAVHMVLDAVLRREPSRYPVASACTKDFHRDPDERDTFKKEHDEHLYSTNPHLFGFDWCYVHEAGYRRTMTLFDALANIQSAY